MAQISSSVIANIAIKAKTKMYVSVRSLLVCSSDLSAAAVEAAVDETMGQSKLGTRVGLPVATSIENDWLELVGAGAVDSHIVGRSIGIWSLGRSVNHFFRI